MLTAEAIQALADAMAARAKPIETPDGGIAVPLPTGYTFAKLPPLDPILTHVKQAVVLHDFASLVAYVDAYKGVQTRIFAEPGFLAKDRKARVVGVLDYHQASSEAPIASRAAHVVTYEPRYSDAWLRWHKACAEPLAQVEFAELIEECRADIVEPNAASLMDIVRTFKATKRTEYDSITYQPDSGVKLHYSETVDKTGSAALLPEQLHLGIAVYYRGAPYKVPVFIRYKVGNGGVKFSLKLDRADLIEDNAFTELAVDLANQTAVPVHNGRL